MRRCDREITDRQEIMEILNRMQVCRLAMQDADGLYIVPMSFGYEWPKDGDLTLYFHCAHEGRRISALKACPEVAFEMDRELQQITAETACGYGCLYESVIGSGRAAFLEEESEKQHALAVLMRQQTGKDFSFTPAMTQGVTVFRVQATAFTVKARKK